MTGLCHMVCATGALHCIMRHHSAACTAFSPICTLRCNMHSCTQANGRGFGRSVAKSEAASEHEQYRQPPMGPYPAMGMGMGMHMGMGPPMGMGPLPMPGMGMGMGPMGMPMPLIPGANPRLACAKSCAIRTCTLLWASVWHQVGLTALHCMRQYYVQLSGSLRLSFLAADCCNIHSTHGAVVKCTCCWSCHGQAHHDLPPDGEQGATCGAVTFICHNPQCIRFCSCRHVPTTSTASRFWTAAQE